MPNIRLACVLGAALTVSACAAKPPASQFPNAAVALERMKASFECARGVQGEGKIDHIGEQGRVRGDVMLLAVDPDRVRFDVISPFGVTLATLTSNGRRFQLLDLRQKVLLEGPPQPCNIARLTQVPIPAHALVKLLRGEAPVLVHEPSAATIVWDGGGYYVVRIASTHEAVQEIHLRPAPEDFDLPYDKQRVQVLAVKVSQRDFVHYTADFDDFEAARTMEPRVDPTGLEPDVPPVGPACQLQIPRKIRVQVPHGDSDVLFIYEEAGLNPPVVPSVFTQPMPGGVSRRFVSCE